MEEKNLNSNLSNLPSFSSNNFSRLKKIEKEKICNGSMPSLPSASISQSKVLILKNDNSNFFVRSRYKRKYELQAIAKKQEEKKKMTTPKRNVLTDFVECSSEKKRAKKDDGELQKQ